MRVFVLVLGLCVLLAAGAGDAAVRQKIFDILSQIGTESAKQGRTEMPRLAEELKIAAQATPSPQQVEVLVDGFDRLTKLWQAAKSGLL